MDDFERRKQERAEKRRQLEEQLKREEEAAAAARAKRQAEKEARQALLEKEAQAFEQEKLARRLAREKRRQNSKENLFDSVTTSSSSSSIAEGSSISTSSSTSLSDLENAAAKAEEERVARKLERERQAEERRRKEEQELKDLEKSRSNSSKSDTPQSPDSDGDMVLVKHPDSSEFVMINKSDIENDTTDEDAKKAAQLLKEKQNEEEAERVKKEAEIEREKQRKAKEEEERKKELEEEEERKREREKRRKEKEERERKEKEEEELREKEAAEARQKEREQRRKDREALELKEKQEAEDAERKRQQAREERLRQQQESEEKAKAVAAAAELERQAKLKKKEKEERQAKLQKEEEEERQAKLKKEAEERRRKEEVDKAAAVALEKEREQKRKQREKEEAEAEARAEERRQKREKEERERRSLEEAEEMEKRNKLSKNAEEQESNKVNLTKGESEADEMDEEEMWRLAEQELLNADKDKLLAEIGITSTEDQEEKNNDKPTAVAKPAVVMIVTEEEESDKKNKKPISAAEKTTVTPKPPVNAAVSSLLASLEHRGRSSSDAAAYKKPRAIVEEVSQKTRVSPKLEDSELPKAVLSAASSSDSNVSSPAPSAPSSNSSTVSNSDFDDMLLPTNDRGKLTHLTLSRAAIRPNRNKRGSINPVRSLAARTDVRTIYGPESTDGSHNDENDNGDDGEDLGSAKLPDTSAPASTAAPKVLLPKGIPAGAFRLPTMGGGGSAGGLSPAHALAAGATLKKTSATLDSPASSSRSGGRPMTIAMGSTTSMEDQMEIQKQIQRQGEQEEEEGAPKVRKPFKPPAGASGAAGLLAQMASAGIKAAPVVLKKTGGAGVAPEPNGATFTGLKRDKCLYVIKGKRRMRMLRVELEPASLSHDESFVLDNGAESVYVWNGSGASKLKRAKAFECAMRVKDKDCGGKVTVVTLEDKDDGDLTSKGSLDFWTVLNKGSKESIANIKSKISAASVNGDDESVEKEADRGTVLYRVVVDPAAPMGGRLEQLTETDANGNAPKVADVSMLDSESCFVLDAMNEVYIWKGKKASEADRDAGVKLAEELLPKAKRASFTKALVVKENVEHASFKDKFTSWADGMSIAPRQLTNVVRKEKTPYITGADLAKREHLNFEDVFSVETKPPLWHYLIENDDGSGAVKMWQVTEKVKNEIPESQLGQFYSSESYVIVYKIAEKMDQHVLYYWHGADSSALDKGAASLYAVEVNRQYGAPMIHVEQGKETDHFVSTFRSQMIVHRDTRESNNIQSIRSNSSPLLYHVRGVTQASTRAVQCPTCSASQLASNACFVAVAPSEATIHVWYGRGSAGYERSVADKTARVLKQLCEGNLKFNIESHSESSESSSFLSVVQPGCTSSANLKYMNDAYLRRAPLDCHRFTPLLLTRSHTTGLSATLLKSLTQTELLPENIYLVDAHFEMFAWLGSGAHADDVKMAYDALKDYQAFAGKSESRKLSSDCYLIFAGNEPGSFKALFPAWDFELAAKNASMATPRHNFKLDPMLLQDAAKIFEHKIIPLKDLQVAPDKLPPGVDARRLEVYLSDEEFEKVFPMKRDEFNSFPAWKQVEIRKKYGLF